MYCQLHYQRFKKHGDPMGGGVKYTNPEDAIKNRTIRNGDCIEWTGYTNQEGYPRMNVGGRLWLVYRYVWEQANGPVPESMEIDHICLNRSCINTAHLRVVTRSQNSTHRRGAQKNSKSGIRNVHKRGKKWVVRLKLHGKQYEFGTYDDIEDAAITAKAARIALFGRP